MLEAKKNVFHDFSKLILRIRRCCTKNKHRNEHIKMRIYLSSSPQIEEWEEKDSETSRNRNSNLFNP